MHTLRIASAFAAGLLACTVLTSFAPLEWASAHAQKLTEVRKKVDRKGPAPKEAPKDRQERASFTADEDDAAVIPGIPDARVWGDSATDFARLLPTGASGPWLAISGGGSDGAYGAGVLTGWTESGTRPEFTVVTGVSIGALIAPFAFLGPRYDEEVHKNFTTIGAAVCVVVAWWMVSAGRSLSIPSRCSCCRCRRRRSGNWAATTSGQLCTIATSSRYPINGSIRGMPPGTWRFTCCRWRA